MGALRPHRPGPRRLPRARCRGRATGRRSGSPPTASQPWLPQPADWAALTVAAQRGDPASTLSLYRAALHLRRDLPALHDAPLDVGARGRRRPRVRPGAGVPVRREPLGPAGRLSPGRARVLLASGPCAGELPPDTAVWLSRPGAALIRRLSSSATAAPAAPIEEHALSEQPDPAQSRRRRRGPPAAHPAPAGPRRRPSWSPTWSASSSWSPPSSRVRTSGCSAARST